jgi:drug/metabolite transporter (DMT)-like permease
MAFCIEVHPMTVGETISAFVKVSILLGLANIFLTLALTITKKTGTVTMIQFANVIWGYLISIFRYNEKINILAICGSICIFFGLMFVLIK